MTSERLLAHTSVSNFNISFFNSFYFKHVGGQGGKASSDTARDGGETTRSQTKPSALSVPSPKSANQFERTTQVPDVLHGLLAEGGSAQLPAHHIAAMRGSKISGNTTTLPHTIQREYFRSNEYDLDGERLDTGEFLFDADASDQGKLIDAPGSNNFDANDRDVCRSGLYSCRRLQGCTPKPWRRRDRVCLWRCRVLNQGT